MKIISVPSPLTGEGKGEGDSLDLFPPLTSILYRQGRGSYSQGNMKFEFPIPHSLRAGRLSLRGGTCSLRARGPLGPAAGVEPEPEAAFRNPRGVALIMVIWVIAILSVVVLEFSYAMRTEINITKNFKEGARLHALAEGGLQRAIVELIYKHDPRVQQLRKTLKAEETPPEKREWVADGRPYLLPFSQGKCEIRVMSEAGKVNINLVSESVLRKIMGNLGLEGEARDIVVDSIMDWKDADDFYRVNGAENAYYQSLKEPYQCKNANLDSIEELLLVRGVTSELFYGKRGKKGEEGSKVNGIGLKDIFSIYSYGEQIDINSASLPVLRVMLGLPGDVAQHIVKAREEKGFQNQFDLVKMVPEIQPFIGQIGTLISYQSTVLSAVPYYTIESRAKNLEKSVRGVKGIVEIDSKEKEGYKIIQWVDAIYP
jgi:general secretion pathway protein K